MHFEFKKKVTPRTEIKFKKITKDFNPEIKNKTGVMSPVNDVTS